MFAGVQRTDEKLLSIGDVAARTGIPDTTLRYYDKVGLLRPDARVGGQRRYSSRTVDKLTVIGLCKRAGFDLDEIKILYGDESPGRTVSRALAREKLDEIDAQIAQLQQARAVVEWGLRCTCARLDDCTCGVHGPGELPGSVSD